VPYFRGVLRWSRLRPANQDASTGSWKELAPVVKRLRQQWPQRLYLSTFADTLMQGLKRQTIRLRLLKIAESIRVTARKIRVSLPRSYPLQPVFRQAHFALRR
jgi:hypothetical protein